MIALAAFLLGLVVVPGTPSRWGVAGDPVLFICGAPDSDNSIMAVFSQTETKPKASIVRAERVDGKVQYASWVFDTIAVVTAQVKDHPTMTQLRMAGPGLPTQSNQQPIKNINFTAYVTADGMQSIDGDMRIYRDDTTIDYDCTWVAVTENSASSGAVDHRTKS